MMTAPDGPSAPNGSGIGDHVTGVGQQGQAVGDHSADNLDQHVAADQGEGDPQALPAGGPKIVLMVVTATGGVLVPY